MNRKKKIITGAVIAAAAAAVIVFFVFRGTSSSGSGGVYVQKVSEVNSRTSGLTNRFSGVVETQKTLKVTFDTARNLSECYVKEGTKVKEGDKLFAYDTRSTEIEIQQKQLEIEKLNTTITNDNTQITSLTNSMNAASAADKPTYSAQILELQAAVAQAEYDIKTKEAEIEKLNKTLSNSTVTAAMAGTVDSIKDITTLSTAEDKTYITIVAEGDFRIKGILNEQNVSEVSEGEEIIVRSRVDDTTWKGKITQIDTSATTSSSDTSYNTDTSNTSSSYCFYADLDDSTGLLLGQHVTVEEDKGQDELKDGIWLSSGWIVKDGDNAYVWAVSEPGKGLQKCQVTLGNYKEDIDVYEITEGLKESDYIAWPSEETTQGVKTTAEKTSEDTDSAVSDENNGTAASDTASEGEDAAASSVSEDGQSAS